VGPTAGLDDVEKRKLFTLPGLEFRPLGRPARSPSLYRLHSCSAVTILKCFHNKIVLQSYKTKISVKSLDIYNTQKTVRYLHTKNIK
jgi:hypothetical protein